MAAEEDVPIRDSARHYEEQFGDKVRQVQKPGARPPASGSGGFGAVGAVVLVVIFLIRVFISLANSSSRESYTPPPAMPAIDFQRFQEQAREQPEAFGPATRRLLGVEDETSYRFEPGDVPLPEGLCFRIEQDARGEVATPGKRLSMFLDPAARALVGRTARGAALGPGEEADLRAALNEALDKPEFFDERYFRGLDLPAEALAALAQRGPGLVPPDVKDVRRLNRLALEAAYPRQVLRAKFRGRLDPQLERRIAALDLEEARRQFGPVKP